MTNEIITAKEITNIFRVLWIGETQNKDAEIFADETCDSLIVSL